jgi:nucleotide-binding universal stress UspA family protein
LTIDFLEAKRRSLEEVFFRKDGERLLERLRAREARLSERSALGSACGIEDEALLERLLALGVRSESVAALMIAPQVAVAWASGSVGPDERRAVLEAAHACAIDSECAACALLTQWLEVRPSPRLLEAWSDYVRVLCERLDPRDRERLRDDVLERAHRVADAEGGLLGVARRESKKELRVIEEIARAFAKPRVSRPCVLVPVDFSEGTGEVIRRARALAAGLGAELRLLHVAPPDPDFVGYDAGPQSVRDQVAAELRAEHRELQEHARLLRQEGLDATALVLEGPTVETILGEAERLGADCVVVGSHGRGAVYRAILGSVSEGVVRGARCPILIVPTVGAAA